MISSVSNEKVKEIKKLRNYKSIIEEEKFIVETRHLVEEAKKNNILLETISLVNEDYGVKNTIVSKNVMKSITLLKSKPDIIGICKTIEDKKTLGNKVIILDNVQDPGNLGTIIRSANAFGFNDIILSSTSVKKYNEKVIRATQGMLFSTNIITRDLLTFIPKLKKEGYLVCGTNVVDGINVRSLKKTNKIAVILGNEGQGISDDIKKIVDNNIYININDSCESLNVSVAASIIMYELNNK